MPVCADYTAGFTLPLPAQPASRAVVYFSGSTIGNLHPEEAIRLMWQIADLVKDGGGLLIGVDLRKISAVIERAYNDCASVRAAFNLNMLARINRELGADFQLDQFRHAAFYSPRYQRIEMRLVSRRDPPALANSHATRIALAVASRLHSIPLALFRPVCPSS